MADFKEQEITGPAAGVIMTLYDRENEATANASDFSSSSFSGFSLTESQKIRCQRMLAKNLVQENCSFSLRDAIRQDTADDILKDCLSLGWRIHTIILNKQPQDSKES